MHWGRDRSGLQVQTVAGNQNCWRHFQVGWPCRRCLHLTSDLLGAYKAHELEQELKTAKESITTIIKSSFKDIYDLIGDDEKLLDFFAPQLKEFEKIVAAVDERSKFIRSNQEKLIQVREKMNALGLPGSTEPSMRALTA